MLLPAARTALLSLALLVTMLVPARASSSPPVGQFLDKVFRDADGEHKYVVFVPAAYTAQEPWPVILFLHGACNRGTDGRSQLISGLAPAIRQRMEDFPFIAVFPQCEDTQSRILLGWMDDPREAVRALEILDEVEKNYHVDSDRRILMGLSMGGCGVYDIAAQTPELWAALVPVSATGKPETAARLSRTPVWAFHANSDPFVPTPLGREMVAALQDAGAPVYFSEVDRRAHDISDVVFTQQALIDWMLAPESAPTQDLAWTTPAGYTSGIEDLPFIPGAEVSGAVRVRLCEDVIEALAFAVQDKAAEMPLTGGLPTMRQSARSGPITVNVTLSGLNYQAQIEQIRIRPQGDDQVQLQVGLRNLTLTIQQSQVRGRLLLAATAGPMHVVIGHRAPVWLNVTVRPRVADRQLHLDVVSTSFQIPADNWHISTPASVHVRAMPLLRGRVAEGLVDGIADKKAEIERQVIASVPQMVKEAEQQVNRAFHDKTHQLGQIPMPIWQPRVKLWPERVVITEQSVTLSLGATIAALGQPTKDFPARRYEAPATASRTHADWSEIALSGAFFTAWTELIIAGEVNRFNTLDFAPPEFHVLGDLAFLQEAIPDLKRLGDDVETRVEYELRDPIRFLDASEIHESFGLTADEARDCVVLQLPSVPMTIAVRQPGESTWTPYGELDLDISRAYRPDVFRPSFDKRTICFAGITDYRVRAEWTFADPQSVEKRDVDVDRLVAAVLEARRSAERQEQDRLMEGKEVPVLSLRLKSLSWNNNHLAVRHELPGILLRNETDQTVQFELRGPTTTWSAPQQLAPGESQTYSAAHSLLCRPNRMSGERSLELPLGGIAAFRGDEQPSAVLVSDPRAGKDSTSLR